jgi:P2 family phage contractile tail tube protein
MAVNANIIAGAISDAEVYVNGAKDLAGIGKVNLPKVSLKKVTASQFGQTAEVEMGMTGHYEKMDFKMTIENINGSLMNTKIGQRLQVEVYFTSQNLNRSTQEVQVDGMIATIIGQVTSFDGGDLKPGEKTEINTDMSVFYYKLTNNGKKVFEVDALNPSSENFGDNRSFINQLLGRI